MADEVGRKGNPAFCERYFQDRRVATWQPPTCSSHIRLVRSSKDRQQTSLTVDELLLEGGGNEEGSVQVDERGRWERRPPCMPWAHVTPTTDMDPTDSCVGIFSGYAAPGGPARGGAFGRGFGRGAFICSVLSFVFKAERSE